ncbi:riboflavin synthase domain-like protein [Rhizodiscina lignyota]|uniref:NADPH--hemoprotein reductase n=1 Tax=Rhizodiscina lignyota TaxID=1504668 RepID=A0A9P4I7L6_9PEZI|nr:riboflavin synthase domain-like protein [Rhizodiscina lignyota]
MCQCLHCTGPYSQISQGLDMVIFWGSQSGRAEVLAKSLASELQNRFGMKVLVADLDDYDHLHLAELNERQIIGFILATYGEGDPPDNTNVFWSTAHELQEKGIKLNNMCYVVFGLGNSKYRQYNRVAESINSTFQKLGASRIGEMGKGDDANGSTEEDFASWKKDISHTLEETLNLQVQNQEYQPAFTITEIDDIGEDAVFLGEPHSSLLRNGTKSKWGDLTAPNVIPIARSRILWQSGQRHCIDIDFDLGRQRLLKYSTGDHLAVWPSNPESEVQSLLCLLGLESKRSTIVKISTASSTSGIKIPVPSPTTIEALFRHYLEICAPISRDALMQLSNFAPSETAAENLRRISDDTTTLKTEILSPHLTFSGILRLVADDQPWNIPLSFLLESVKGRQPRYYSISSSAVVQPRCVSITAVVDTGPQASGTLNHCFGLTTGLLSDLCHAHMSKDCSSDATPLAYSLSGPRDILEGGKIFGRIRRSTFKLPPKASTGVILIGTGTGVAPFRGFLQERVRMKEIGKEVGKTLLFMGFRHPDEDFLYADELKQCQLALGEGIFKIHTAFSREVSSKKVYVQDRLQESAAEVLELLESDHRSSIYICGAASMARDVSFCLANIRMSATGASDEEAAQWLTELRRSARYLEDVWG